MLLLALATMPRTTAAHPTEPGQFLLGLGMGPGLSLSSRLGTQPADFLLLPLVELVVSQSFAVVGGGTFGFGGTMPAFGRLGLRYRAPDLGIALSPYAQVEYVGGGLLRVLGSRLRWMGARLGLGVEYVATDHIHVGVGLGIALGGTLGPRPALYGLFDGMLYTNFALNSPAPRAALSAEFTPAPPHAAVQP